MDVLCLCPVSGFSIALCPMSCLVSVSVSCPVSVSWPVSMSGVRMQYPQIGKLLNTRCQQDWRQGKLSDWTNMHMTGKKDISRYFFSKKVVSIIENAFVLYFKCIYLLVWSCHVSSSLWSTVCMIKHLLGCSRVTSAVKTFFSKLIILIKLKPSTKRGLFPNWQNDGVDNGLRDCDEKVPMCPWLVFQQGLLGNRAKFHKGLRTRPLATPSAPQP